MMSPPRSRVQCPEVLGPEGSKVIRNSPVEFAGQSGSRDSDGAANLHELREVVEIQIVRPEVGEGINTDNGVEEARGEGERSSIRVERKHAVLDAGITDSLRVLRRMEPEVRGPNLHGKLSPQEY